MHFATAPLRVKEHQAVEKLDAVGGTYTPIEVFQVSATAEGYMLTIIDVFAIRENIGRRPAAKKRTLLQQSYAPASFSQRDAGR
jgi:hypothetical protein